MVLIEQRQRMVAFDQTRGFSELVALDNTFAVFATQHQRIFAIEYLHDAAAVAAVHQDPAHQGSQLLQKLAVHVRYSELQHAI